MSTPRVSIGMPVHNGGRLIQEAIRSILEQSFEDFELIICDNASTDDTEEICRGCAKRDPRIRYERNYSNMGAAYNFNKTFLVAGGKYFKWLQSMESRAKRGESLSFVIAVNDETVFRDNVLASPIFEDRHPHEVRVRRNFPSASLAYNDAIAEASNDILVIMHQDVYLPIGWDVKLACTFDYLRGKGRVGVLGCYGVSGQGKRVGHVYSNGLRKELGSPQDPVPLLTLDELVLVFQKSTELKFDPLLPHFHLYGTDICL